MADENKNLKNEHGKVFFQWSFLEFPHYERNRQWYAWLAVVVGLLILYSIFSANFLFALISIITALIILLFHQSKNEVNFKITEDGILVNAKFYDYKELENFYIIYEPPQVKTLYFEPKSFFNPRIPVDLQNQNPVKIRETLKKYLAEDIERENEPLSDQTSRMLKL